MSQPGEPSKEAKEYWDRRAAEEQAKGILSGPYPCCPSKANLETARTLLTRVLGMLPPACANTRREINEFLEQLP